MNIAELLSGLKKGNVVNTSFTSIETKYGVIFPIEIRKIISFCQEGIFLEGSPFCRLLSNDEILNADEYLHVDFASLGIIPIFDTGDNDFVVFDYKNNKWMKFNIVDESKWGKKDTIEELFNV